MKKSIFALAMLAVSAFGFQAFAQNNAPAAADNSPKTKTEKAEKAHKANLFEGIDLTADQQSKLTALREQRMKERAERKAQRTADASAAKKTDRKKDMAKADGAKKQPGARSEARAKQLAAIKEILTPEQYTKYLENSVTMSPRHNKAKGMKAGRGGKRSHSAGMASKHNGQRKGGKGMKNREGAQKSNATQAQS